MFSLPVSCGKFISNASEMSFLSLETSLFLVHSQLYQDRMVFIIFFLNVQWALQGLLLLLWNGPEMGLILIFMGGWRHLSGLSVHLFFFSICPCVGRYTVHNVLGVNSKEDAHWLLIQLSPQKIWRPPTQLYYKTLWR